MELNTCLLHIFKDLRNGMHGGMADGTHYRTTEKQIENNTDGNVL